MAHNRYYPINANDPNKEQILSFSVGTPESQRYSIDGAQLVIKLYEGDHQEHPQLSQYIEYSHDDILQFLNSPKWTYIVTS